MLVYGDRGRTADPRKALAAVLARLDAAEALPAGLERHTALITALIACGDLAQGLADAAFEATGLDAPDPAADAALDLTRAIAEAALASWRSLSPAPSVTGVTSPALRERGKALAALALPDAVTLKEGEGFAFYAVYPETYAAAAEGLSGAPTLVLGLRSIGTTLGAVAAAALGAERFITARPTGHPFRRALRLDPRLAPSPGVRVAVVDEGPGLSGSSFGAGLDWAELGIVSRETLAFPSHLGDLGPEATAGHRARWARIPKPFKSFDEVILPRLPAWVEDLTGRATEPLQDLSGGAWRALRYGSEAQWPAVNAGGERRKFLLRSARGDFLLKFAGLGAVGERKLERARRLAAGGFTVAPLGVRHGFLVEPWIAPADSGSPWKTAWNGDEVVLNLARYLRFRALNLSEGADSGADPGALLKMMRVNAGEALGPAFDPAIDEAVEVWRDRLPGLAAQVRRVVTDNRLHPHEWIASEDGRWLKTDALDHAQAHDLVGCQDIAWDVAGAAVEFNLDPDQSERLWRAVHGGKRNAEFLRFHRLAYLAFQLGATSMAADGHAGWPEEAARLDAVRARYAEKLRQAIGSLA